jgi:hypothetical protein
MVDKLLHRKLKIDTQMIIVRSIWEIEDANMDLEKRLSERVIVD